MILAVADSPQPGLLLTFFFIDYEHIKRQYKHPHSILPPVFWTEFSGLQLIQAFLLPIASGLSRYGDSTETDKT